MGCFARTLRMSVLEDLVAEKPLKSKKRIIQASDLMKVGALKRMSLHMCTTSR